MQNKKRIFFAVITMLLAVPAAIRAQGNSSLNTFSPFTFYGVGDFAVQGPSYLRAMGGAGVAFHNSNSINTLNPASLGSTLRKTFLFNFEMEGQNFYMKTEDKRTSFSTFNVKEVSIQFPVYKYMGISVSTTPLTRVGYRVSMDEMDPYVLAHVGRVQYDYNGDGGIAQFKVSYGARLGERLYLGVDGIYYKGNINRYYDVNIEPVLTMSDASWSPTRGSAIEKYSKFNFNVGMNYDLIFNAKRALSLGATFQPKVNMMPAVTNLITAGSIHSDTVSYEAYDRSFYLPNTVNAGLFYQTKKISLGLDYMFQHWKGLNAADLENGIKFGNSNTVKAGMQFTPNKYDIRHALNRWSYRVGVRYSDYYMIINDNKIHDLALTFGVGIPIKVQGYSSINIGAEIGRRGDTAVGTYGTRQFNMVRENYFKISIGLNFFGEDGWFRKFKYD